MPQASYIYANARVGVAQTRLLTVERVERMTEAKDAPEALKVLQEAGYGGNREVKSAFDFQQLIDDELRKAYDFVYEITPDKEATDLFLVQFDFHNVKALVKSRLLEEEADDALLYPVGTVPLDSIRAAVRDRDYRTLPAYLAEPLDALDQSLAGKVDPQALDTFVDRAMYAYIFEVLKSPGYGKHLKNGQFISEYFRAQCDLTNLITLLRARSAGLTREEFAALLMPGQDIGRPELLEAFEQPLETVSRQIGAASLSGLISQGIEEYIKTGSTARMERLRDDHLFGLAMTGKHDIFGIGPVIGYLLAREQEARAVRLVMTAKLNHIPVDVVRERLRELYA